MDVFPLDGGGFFLGATAASETLTYTLNVPRAGFYDLSLRVQTPAPADVAPGVLLLTADGVDLPARQVVVAAENTAAGSGAEWRLLEIPDFYLTEGVQQLTLAVVHGGFGLDYLEWLYVEEEIISPAAAVAAMGVGINLGNTLDAPTEGAWARAAERRYFEDFAAAGFGHVRVPVTWDAHVAVSPPYTVDPVFLARVEQVLDWALAQGRFVVVNAHHEAWLKENYGSAGLARFTAIWQQVAQRLQHKPPRLLFEILNEPNGMNAAQADQVNAAVLPVMRAANPTRLVVFSGHGFTPVDSLLAAAVPDDAYLIGNFHSYDPWPFAGQCLRGWGSDADRAELATIYQKAATWSMQHNIPVTVNEVGVAHYDFLMPQNICDPAARLAYLQAHKAEAAEKGIAITVWDDDGSFRIYHRQTGAWGPEKNVLVGE